jgi:hypothetical protein
MYSIAKVFPYMPIVGALAQLKNKLVLRV